MFKFLCFFILSIILQVFLSEEVSALGEQNPKSVYHVVKSDDFDITGDGSSDNWSKASWLKLIQHRPVDNDGILLTKAKVLYSQTGIYFLFHCQDNILTATMDTDFMDLWKEDVVEVFLWPDEAIPAYFEYELSPLNCELAILVSNIDSELHRWQPFHYEPDRKAKHATTVFEGEKISKAPVSAWTAEFFIPYKLLRPLKNIPPQKGTKWRANFYRIDYDDGVAGWSWQPTERSYHEIEKFGTIFFD